jgi:hypothetical protein
MPNGFYLSNDGIDIPDRDSPTRLTDQLDHSNGIVRQWMIEDPAFAAQINAAHAQSLYLAAYETGDAVNIDGEVFVIPGSEAEGYLAAADALLDALDGALPFF